MTNTPSTDEAALIERLRKAVNLGKSTGRYGSLPTNIYVVADKAADTISRLVAERDEARLLVTEANNSLYGSQGYFHSLDGGPFDKYHLANGIEKLKAHGREQWGKAESAERERDELRAEAERLREDKERLDFLDRCNASLNAHYGTNYRWELILNHNVTRLMLGHMVVDLNDMKVGGVPSCRAAIDEHLARSRARTALGEA